MNDVEKGRARKEGRTEGRKEEPAAICKKRGRQRPEEERTTRRTLEV